MKSKYLESLQSALRIVETPNFQAYRRDQDKRRAKRLRFGPPVAPELKSNCCDRCGFVPEHPCQLDLDHVLPKSRGGRNDRSNLQTLCSNCHRLKTFLERAVNR